MGDRIPEVEGEIVWGNGHTAFLSRLEKVLGTRLDMRTRFQVCCALRESGLASSPTLFYAAEGLPSGEEILRRWYEGELVIRFPENEPSQVLGDVESEKRVDQPTV